MVVFFSVFILALHKKTPSIATATPTNTQPVTQKNAKTEIVSDSSNNGSKVFVPAIVNGLITNEYAHYNPNDATSLKTADWDMTSGSLFAQEGVFWTGNPDECEPNARSTNCTNSAVFRANTNQKFDGNTKVSLALKQLTNIHNANCNANDTCWHGTHIWLRYQSQFNLYYASVNRADGSVVLKRKVPCGNDNSGTYYVLGKYVKHDFKLGSWNQYAATIQTNADKSVTLKLYDTDVSSTVPVVTGIDQGGTNTGWSPGCKTAGKYPSSHYDPITAAGSVGVRGDYSNFLFKDMKVSNF